MGPERGCRVSTETTPGIRVIFSRLWSVFTRCPNGSSFFVHPAGTSTFRRAGALQPAQPWTVRIFGC
jgi:hypothetical protein